MTFLLNLLGLASLMGEGILSQLNNDYPRTPEHGSYSVILTHLLRRMKFKEAVCPMNLE